MTNKKKTGKQLSPPETVGTDYPLESARSRFENANYLAVEDLRAICTTLDKINNIEGVEEDAVDKRRKILEKNQPHWAYLHIDDVAIVRVVACIDNLV